MSCPNPRFLKSAVNQISSLLSHGLTGATKGELSDSPAKEENSSEFTPVKGSPKAFPPFSAAGHMMAGGNDKDSFSQRADSVASSSAWTPHLLPPPSHKGGDEEKEPRTGESKFTEEQLERFKDLLRRQKRIKQGFLKSLQLSKGRGAPIDVQLEEGQIPKEEAASKQEETMEKPFIDVDFDIDGDKLRAQQRKRRREEQKPVKFEGPVPGERRDEKKIQDVDDKTEKEEEEGGADEVEEEMKKSGNNHIPVFVTSAGGMHNPHHLNHEVVEMLDSGVWSPHGDKVPTLHYTAAQLMSALSKGNLPHVRKNKDGRLEIPIKLDAHISIPEFQQAFANLFQNYTRAGITLHDAHGQPHGGKTNRPEMGYVPPDKNGKDVTGFALLGNVPQSIYHPPSFIYEPPTSGYSHPDQENSKDSSYSVPPPILSLYSLPNDNYESPNSGYSPPKPSYQPPTSLYEPPQKEEESSYKPPHKDYQAPKSSYGPTGPPASLYETPNNNYKPPKASYGPPDKLKSLYDTPFKEYKAPKASYEEPKEYSAPKDEYGPPNKPKLDTDYKPPSSLYQPPKESLSYEAPKKEYKSPKPSHPDSLYETPVKEYKAPKEPKTSYNPPTSLYKPPEISSSYDPPSDSYTPPEAKVPKSLYQTPKTPKKSIYDAIQSLKPPNELYKTPEKPKPTESGYTYAPPPGYKSDKNPTFPDAVYSAAPGISAEVYQITVSETPHVAVKTLPLPSGYDYRAPFGFSAEHNPTFPHKELYQPPPKQAGYKAPEGYDYSTPEGYKASENPTFPKELYQEPEEEYKPPLTEKDKNGYGYNAPNGYSPHENPTFPKELYEAPKKPDDGYETPSGYDYKGPQGYDPSKNPTFPKSHYETPKKDSPKIPHSSPTKGYKAPTGYDYGAPKGYNPSDNPTFPKTSKKEHVRGKAKHPGKKYKAGLDTGYTPPGLLGGGQQQQQKETEGQRLPSKYDYTPPDGYDASENPTFPKKPVEGYQYSPPPGQDPSHNPTFPHRPPPPISSLYNLPGESHVGGLAGYPKHSFNIIIKNKDEPPTELRINADGHHSRHSAGTQLRLGSNSVLQKKSGEPADTKEYQEVGIRVLLAAHFVEILSVNISLSEGMPGINIVIITVSMNLTFGSWQTRDTDEPPN